MDKEGESSALKGCRAVLTCRVANFSDSPRIPVYTLGLLSKTSQKQLIKLYGERAVNKLNYNADRLQEQINQSSHLQDLVELPLLLEIICFVSDDPNHRDLPSSRAHLYNRAISKMLDRAQRHQNTMMTNMLRPVTLDEKRFALEQAAFDLFMDARFQDVDDKQMRQPIVEALRKIGERGCPGCERNCTRHIY